MNKSKRNGGKKIPFDSVIKNYRIKQPKQAFERIRYWDEGRKYDLLRCITTLVYVSWKRYTVKWGASSRWSWNSDEVTTPLYLRDPF